MGRKVMLIFRESQLLGEAKPKRPKVLILLPCVAYYGKIKRNWEMIRLQFAANYKKKVFER